MTVRQTDSRNLRAVPGGRSPRKRATKKAAAKKDPKKPDVAQAAASGNHKALLVAMRDRIAITVRDPECPPRDLAALTRRLQDIAKEIEAIELRAKQEAAEDAIEPDEPWDEEAL